MKTTIITCVNLFHHRRRLLTFIHDTNDKFFGLFRLLLAVLTQLLLRLLFLLLLVSPLACSVLGGGEEDDEKKNIFSSNYTTTMLPLPLPLFDDIFRFETSFTFTSSRLFFLRSSCSWLLSKSKRNYISLWCVSEITSLFINEISKIMTMMMMIFCSLHSMLLLLLHIHAQLTRSWCGNYPLIFQYRDDRPLFFSFFFFARVSKFDKNYGPIFAAAHTLTLWNFTTHATKISVFFISLDR
jgi:hypothetical protein